MKRTLLAVAFILFTAAPSHAQSIVGDWEGTLQALTADLHVALHVEKNEDGSLKATLDSIDQKAFGVPATSIALTGTTLLFAVDAFHGSYEGTVNAGGTAIDGMWTQGARMHLAFRRAAARPAVPPPAPVVPVVPSDIDGTWMGTLTIGATPLRVVVHLRNTSSGLVATMDSPDQGVNGIPVADVSRAVSSLRLDVRANGGVFDGKINDTRTSIEGTWSQGSLKVPLTLTPVKDPSLLERRRPQNPSKPYPYREEDVSFENAGAHVTLAATLTLPPGAGPFPAVLLITGSGPQDRDESLAGHRPFLVLADYLTRHGIAVLRADDRGFGKSTGTFATATTADFATDAEAGVAYLRTRREVDARKIGLIGHSEGGMIAPMVAARDHAIAFIVMMAGTGVSGDDVLVAQNILVAEAMGATHDQAEAQGAQIRALTDIMKTEPDSAARDKAMREMLAGRKVPPALADAQIKAINTPWFRYMLAYDPAIALKQVTCPVLALNGELDLQVPPTQNLPAIRAALDAGGNKHVQIEPLSGLNHLFQTAKTGSPAEYAQIEETISPVALDAITRWISKVTSER
jgi:pimeloyl-ACP methyl ester carboxylesterase